MPRRGSGQLPKLKGDDFGKRLAMIRKEKRVTAKILAEKAGVDEQYIYQLENGYKTPSFETLIRLTNALKTTTNDLLFDYLDTTESVFYESYIGKMLSQIPKQLREQIESHILLEIKFLEETKGKRN